MINHKIYPIFVKETIEENKKLQKKIFSILQEEHTFKLIIESDILKNESIDKIRLFLNEMVKDGLVAKIYKNRNGYYKMIDK